MERLFHSPVKIVVAVVGMIFAGVLGQTHPDDAFPVSRSVFSQGGLPGKTSSALTEDDWAFTSRETLPARPQQTPQSGWRRLPPGARSMPSRQPLAAFPPAVTAAGDTQRVEYSQDWTDSAWATVDRTTDTYDADWNLLESLDEDWVALSFSWVNSWRDTYTYDASGNLTEWLYQAWNAAASTWVNSWRDTSYTYDDSGNLL